MEWDQRFPFFTFQSTTPSNQTYPCSKAWTGDNEESYLFWWQWGELSLWVPLLSSFGDSEKRYLFESHSYSKAWYVWTEIAYVRRILYPDYLIIEDDLATVVAWIQKTIRRKSIHLLLFSYLIIQTLLSSMYIKK